MGSVDDLERKPNACVSDWTRDCVTPLAERTTAPSWLLTSLVPSSLQRMHIDGVTYRRLKGPDQPTLPLDLASRRGDPSAVVRHFLKLVRQAAKDFQYDASERDIHRARRRK